MDKLMIVVPCYNEEEILEMSATKLLKKLTQLIQKDLITLESQIVFIDDGSRDKTWEIIQALSNKHDSIKGIKLSRNYGQQNATLAGLFSLDADLYITIDVDLQDDIDALDSMVLEYNKGFEIVYGVRKNRDSDTFFKRQSAVMFYKFIRYLGVDIVDNHSEFRLMNRRTVEALKSYNEVNLFLRGIVPLIGFKSINVYFDRKNRDKGESKYSKRKLFSLAWQGVTSFSVIPLRMITVIGFSVFFLSIVLGIWVLYNKFFTATAVPGWASSMLIINFVGGLQLLSLGVIGEYIGKIYQEVKQRPRYFIDQII
ncbi:MAG: glycosyltransferase family 2 protein [Epsilonproteobacteria bacterium]|nr:glycosyltransferase family 2 protein [Campylobacterota bacterium]